MSHYLLATISMCVYILQGCINNVGFMPKAPFGYSISGCWLILVQLPESAAPARFFPSSAKLQQQLFEFKKMAAKATFIAIQTQGSSPLQPLQHSNELKQQQC